MSIYNRETLVSRIEALLSLAKGRGATPAEAARAMEAAQRLMEKYQISQLEAEAQGEKNRAEFGKELWGLGYKGLPLAAKFVLLMGVTRACYCDLVRASSGPNAWILGKSEQREVVKAMFMRLEMEITRLAAVGWAAEKDTYVGREHQLPSARAWKNDFCNGAASVVGQRLKDYRAELDRAETTETRALMVVDDTALKAYTAQEFPQLRTSHLRTRMSSAYAQGRTAGGGVDLGFNRKIGGQS